MPFILLLCFDRDRDRRNVVCLLGSPLRRLARVLGTQNVFVTSTLTPITSAASTVAANWEYLPRYHARLSVPTTKLGLLRTLHAERRAHGAPWVTAPLGPQVHHVLPRVPRAAFSPLGAFHAVRWNRVTPWVAASCPSRPSCPPSRAQSRTRLSWCLPHRTMAAWCTLDAHTS